MLVGGVALGTFIVGGLLFCDFGGDRFYKLLGVFVAIAIFFCTGSLAFMRVRRQRGEASATVLEVSPEWPREIVDLGPPVAGYQTAASAAVQLIILGLLSGSFGIIGIVAALSGHHDHRWLELGLVCSTGCLIAVGGGIRNLLCRVQVLVYRDGLAHIKGGQCTSRRWEEIDAVYRNWTEQYEHRTPPNCTVVFQGGDVWALDSRRLAGFDRLASLIEQETTSRMFPIAEAELKAGASVEFGPLTVGPEGVIKRAKVLSWGDIAEIKMDKGDLAVVEKDKWLSWCKVPLSKVANLQVFLRLEGAHRLPQEVAPL
jgi:hypothetical protein